MASRKSRSKVRRPSRAAEPVGTLRVIGGALRGRPIQYLGDPRTRPMKQRVREAAFNLVGRRVVGTHVVDLFAGTGALTWEALSRGASSATLVERHFPSARLLRDNATKLDLLSRVEVFRGDTFYWARKLDLQQMSPQPSRPWLVFCSPPYELYVAQADAMLQLIGQLIDAAPPRSCLLVESDRRFDTARLPERVPWDIRPYPPAVLALAEVERPA